MNPLTIFPRHPSAPDTYYINGAWAPAAITAVDKRFSPGELAAEYWMSVACEMPSKEVSTLRRFMRRPNHDDGPA